MPETNWLQKIIDLLIAKAEEEKKARWPGAWVPSRPSGQDMQRVWTQNEIDALKKALDELQSNVTTNAQEAIPIPAACTDVTATESPSKSADGTMKSQVSVSFSNADPNFASAKIFVIGYNGSTTPTLAAEGTESPISFLCETTKETISLKVVALNANGQYADLSTAPSVSVTLDGVVSAPPAPSIASGLVNTALGYTFAFNQLPAQVADVVDGYKIYHHTANDAAAATQLTYIKHDPTNSRPVQVQEVQPLSNTTQYWYWVSAVNTSGLESAKTAVGAATKGGVPLQVTGVSATESPYRTKDGQIKSLVSVSFTPGVGDAYFSKVQVYFTGYNGSAKAQLMAEGSTSPFSFLCDTTNETVTVTVLAVGLNGQTPDMAFAPTTTVLLDGVTSAPAGPTISQSLIGTPTGYQFAFTQLAGLSADVIDSYRVYRNTTNNSGTASLYQTIKHDRTNGGNIIVQDPAQYGELYYYWVTSVNTSGLESTKVAAQSGTVAGHAASAQLVVNQAVSLPGAGADGDTIASWTAGNAAQLPITGLGYDIYTDGSSNRLMHVLLWASNDGSSKPNGYMFRLDLRSGQPRASIYKVTSGAWGSAISTAKISSNATDLKQGWYRVRLEYFQTGLMNMYVNGVWCASAQDTTYSPTGATYYQCPAGNGSLVLAPGDGLLNSLSNGWSTRSSPLVGQGSLVNIPTDTFSYSSTPTSMTWSWGDFSLYAPDGSTFTIAAGSAPVFTGLTSSTTYHYFFYVTLSTLAVTVTKSSQAAGTSPESTQTLVQVAQADGRVAIRLDATGATPSSGTGGGGGGGGGGCFTGNTKVVTERGPVAIADLKQGDRVRTAKGTFCEAEVISHDFEGLMCDMGDGELSTDAHRVLLGGRWVEMSALGDPLEHFEGVVFNLHVDAEDDGSSEDTEHSYTLANGRIVHNLKAPD